MAQSPCLFTPLANSLLLQSHSSFTYLENLLGVILSRPPWPQVTRELTSPFPSPLHSRLLMVRNKYYPADFKIARENRYIRKICMILVSVVCRPSGHKMYNYRCWRPKRGGDKLQWGIFTPFPHMNIPVAAVGSRIQTVHQALVQ
jgi:hypothetical protein